LGHFWKLVADFVLLCPERAFCVKICPTAREKCRRGFDDFCVGICREVLIKRAGVAEIGEFLVVSAVSSCVLSLSKGTSGFPGLGVAGAISGIFSGTSDNLRVRTAKKALWFCQGISNYIAIILNCCIHIIVTVARRSSEQQLIDCVDISFTVHSGLDSPGLISRRMSGVLLVYGYSG
jgi:hypothetical protein